MNSYARAALLSAAWLLCAAVLSVLTPVQAQVQAPVLASTQPAPKVPAAPTTVPGAAANEPAVNGTPNEPAVKRNVVEDDNARIEELNVRGAVRSITVSPKGPIKAPYEVLPTDASVDPSDGPASTKGAQGRRVWRVLSF